MITPLVASNYDVYYVLLARSRCLTMYSHMYIYSFMVSTYGVTIYMYVHVCVLLAADSMVCYWVTVCTGLLFSVQMSYRYRCTCGHVCTLLYQYIVHTCCMFYTKIWSMYTYKYEKKITGMKYITRGTAHTCNIYH